MKQRNFLQIGKICAIIFLIEMLDRVDISSLHERWLDILKREIYDVEFFDHGREH